MNYLTQYGEEDPQPVQEYRGQPLPSIVADEPVRWRRFLSTAARFIMSKLQLGVLAGEARLHQEIEKVRNLQADTAIKTAEAELRQLEILERVRLIERDKLAACGIQPQESDVTQADLEAWVAKATLLRLKYGMRLDVSIIEEVLRTATHAPSPDVPSED